MMDILSVIEGATQVNMQKCFNVVACPNCGASFALMPIEVGVWGATCRCGHFCSVVQETEMEFVAAVTVTARRRCGLCGKDFSVRVPPGEAILFPCPDCGAQAMVFVSKQ